MKLRSLKREQFIDKTLKQVFAFFESPENLAKITPPSLGFKTLTPSPIVMKEGALIDYTVRTLGFTIRWTTLVTCFDPPNKFVDQQLKGPYSFWHHTHTFAEKSGGTVVNDEVIYAMPFGIIGDIIHALFVRRQLRNIFDYRAKVIEQYFSI